MPGGTILWLHEDRDRQITVSLTLGPPYVRPLDAAHMAAGSLFAPSGARSSIATSRSTGRTNEVATDITGICAHRSKSVGVFLFLGDYAHQFPSICGNDVVIDMGDGTLTLVGVDVDDLSANDFIFG